MPSTIGQTPTFQVPGRPSYQELAHMAEAGYPAEDLWRAPANQIIYTGYNMIEGRMQLQANLMQLEDDIADFSQSFDDRDSLALTASLRQSLMHLKTCHWTFSRKLNEDEKRADYLFESLQIAPDFKAPDSVEVPGAHIAQRLEYFFRLRQAKLYPIPEDESFASFGTQLSIQQLKVIEFQIRQLFTKLASDLRDISVVTQQLNSLHEIQVILSDDHVRELISRLEALPTPPPESSDSSSEDGHDVDSGDGHDVNSNDADDDTESEEG